MKIKDWDYRIVKIYNDYDSYYQLFGVQYDNGGNIINKYELEQLYANTIGDLKNTIELIVCAFEKPIIETTQKDWCDDYNN